MKKSFVEILIEKKLFIIIICVMVVLGGIISYINMPKQHFPEVILPVASVTAVYPGAYAEDMEQLVAKPLEETAMTLDGFDSCTTQVYENACAVMVVLDMGLNQEEVNDSFDDLRLKIDALLPTLPSGVQQISVDTDIMDTAGLLLAVSSNDVSGDELAQRTGELKDRLKLLNDVERVDIVGEQLSEIAVTADVAKLNSLNISLTELASIISAQNSLIPTGEITVDDNNIAVHCNSKFASLEEIRDLVVGADSSTGILYRLADVADVRLQVPDDSACYYYNGTPATVLALYFANGINVVTMGDTIRDMVADFSSALPDNIQVNEIYFQPDVVNKAVNSFVINLLESILLVLAVVMVGMGPPYTALMM